MPLATAALLASGQSLTLTSHAIAIIAAIGLAHCRYFLAPLAIWPIGIYFSFRVALDAELFRLLPANAAELDVALQQWGLKRSAGVRTIQDRCQGAVRLWRA